MSEDRETMVDPGGVRESAPVLAVVVPTYRERDNLRPLTEAIATALAGIPFEIVIVDDDSPDGTAARARSMAQADPRIRVIQRLHRRGLATACIEGMLATAAPYLAVIDADMQHDERLLPEMLRTLREGTCDIVIGSRYIEGGGTGAWAGERLRISRLGTLVAQMVLRRPIGDPLSGFFMLGRGLLDRTARRMSSSGFKILVDLLLSAETPPRVLELPYTMRCRELGESKLDLAVALDLVLLLVHKGMRRALPPRFLRFLASGLVGGAFHLAVLGLFHLGAGVAFPFAQASATGAAMTINFAVNNRLTYRERRLRGLAELGGLLRFCLASSIGAAVNIAVADRLFGLGASWWIAGLCGTALGSVLNFALSSLFVWARPPRTDEIAASPSLGFLREQVR
ncbi:MAG: glycosyltransferase family 2 protein [Geminicoccaceae bacterium]